MYFTEWKKKDFNPLFSDPNPFISKILIVLFFFFLGKVIFIKISFKRETGYTRDGRSPIFF